MDQFKMLLGVAVDIQKAQNELNAQIKRIKLEAPIEVTTASAKKAIKELSVESQKLLSQNKIILDNKISAYLKENSRLSTGLKNELLAIQQNINNVDSKGLKDLSKQFTIAQTEAKKLGQTGRSLADELKSNFGKVVNWISLTTVFFGITRGIKNTITTVIELDTAMIDLRKTTSATNQEYEQFYLNASKTAKQLGVTTQQVISQTAEWSRLGYNIKEASKLAENSAIFKAISPNMDINKATDGIVSIMKAYKIDVNDTLDGIISKINAVGNSFAVSNSMIVEMMTRSSSAMAAANNTLEETIALGTAGMEITRDAEGMGQALKTISMRIRGMNEETEELDETLSNVNGKIHELTNVSIMQDANTYKSTYQILKEIAGVWDTLTDKAQAETLELITGKRQAQIGAAIISNFSQAEKSLETMLNSQGNAMKEMEIIYDSIEYRINRYKQSVVGLAQTTTNTDFIKGFVDSGTNFVTTLDDIIKNIGLLPTLIGGVTLALGLMGKQFGVFSTTSKSITNFNSNINKASLAITRYNSLSNQSASFQAKYNSVMANSNTSLGKYLSSLNGAKASMGGYIGSLISAKAATIGLQVATTALNMALTMGLAFAIQGIVTGISKLVNAKKQALETTSELAEKAKSFTSELSTLTIRYNELTEAVKTDESAKDSLISTQNELLEKLGLEGKSIDDLTTKYGSLTEAIRQTSLEELQFAQANLILGVGASEDDLKKAGSSGFFGNKNTISGTGKDAVKAFQVLEKEGLVKSGLYGSGGGALVLTGDDSTIDGILENYNILIKAQQALTKSIEFTSEELKDNNLYVNINKRISELAPSVESYNDSITSLNKNLANQHMIISLQGKELPKTVEEFENFKQEIVDSAIASQNFIGTEEEIKSSVIGFLSTVPQFSKYFTESTEVLQDYTNSTKSFIEANEKQIDDYQKSISTIGKALENIKKLSPSEIIDLMQEFPDLKKYGYTGSEGIKALELALRRLAEEQYNNLNESVRTVGVIKDMYEESIKASEALNQLTKANQDATQGFKDIDLILNAVIQKQKLTDQQALDLANRYDGLADRLIRTTNGWYLEESAINVVGGAMTQLANASIAAQNRMTEVALSNANKRMLAFGIDLQNISTLAEANRRFAMEFDERYRGGTVAGSHVIKAEMNEFIKNWYDLQNEIDKANKNLLTWTDTRGKIDNTLKKYNESLKSSSSSSTKTEDLHKKAFETELKNLKYSLDMKKITEAKYYSELEKLNNRYFRNKKQYLDEYRKYEVEVFNGLLNLQKQAISDIEALANIRVQMIRHEKQQAKDALNAVKSAEKEKLDATLKVIDARKKAIEIMREEENYADNVAEKNKNISKLKADLLRLELDNSASAQRRKLEIEEELAKLTKDLTDYQADYVRKQQLKDLDNLAEKEKEAHDKKVESLDKQLEAIDDYLSKQGLLFQDALKDLNGMNQNLYQNMINWNNLYGVISRSLYIVICLANYTYMQVIPKAIHHNI